MFSFDTTVVKRGASTPCELEFLLLLERFEKSRRTRLNGGPPTGQVNDCGIFLTL
jgi:hypothetical protein